MKTIDIPNGPKNITLDVDWSEVTSYEITTKFKNDYSITVFNEISCCCSEDKIRIHFINSLGRVDAINFNHKEESLETKSNTWQKSLGFPLTKSDGGTQRFNMKSNETYKASNVCYREEDMEWIKELFNSPLAWIEWKGTEGQPDDYIPIAVLDKKVIIRKKENRYIYEIQIDFAMANENTHLRN